MSIYGLIIGICLAIGISFFQNHNRVIPKKLENRFIFLVLLFSILGARLYHVVDQWQYYSQNPWQIPQTWNGGLGIYGGLVFGLVYIFLFSKFHRLNFLKILDIITPIIPLCQAIGRLGNFFNREIPTWWQESLLNLILFLLIRHSSHPSARYLIGYGTIRFFLEFFRTDTWQIHNLKIAHLISIIFIATGLFLLHKPNLTKK